MAMKLSKQHVPMGGAHVGELYKLVMRCETNNTSAPDGDEPSAVTWTRTGAGALTATLPANIKPRRVISGIAYFEESTVGIRAVYTGYTASTGAVTVHTEQIGAAAQSATLKMYNLGLRFTGADGSNPTSPDPTTDITWARTGEGVWTGTFDAGVKPLEVTVGTCNVEGGAAGDYAQVDSYVYASGILTVKGWKTGAAVEEADDLDGKVVSINLLCTDTAIAATVAAQKAALALVPAAADTTDKTLVVELLCTDNPVNDA